MIIIVSWANGATLLLVATNPDYPNDGSRLPRLSRRCPRNGSAPCGARYQYGRVLRGPKAREHVAPSPPQSLDLRTEIQGMAERALWDVSWERWSGS